MPLLRKDAVPVTVLMAFAAMGAGCGPVTFVTAPPTPVTPPPPRVVSVPAPPPTVVYVPAPTPPPVVVVRPPPQVVQVVPLSAGKVTFYTEPNFRGDWFIVEAGSSMDRLSAWNDDISSFRIDGPVTVVAYTDDRFRGQTLETSSSLGDLIAERRGSGVNWDNAISSLRVIGTQRGFDRQDLAPRVDARYADNVIRRAYRDLLGRDPDPAGVAHYKPMILDGSMSEDALRDKLRNSAEHGRVDWRPFITSLYREILKRDPDPGGLEYYRSLMADKGWTEAQVRADLLRSDEGINKRAP